MQRLFSLIGTIFILVSLAGIIFRFITPTPSSLNTSKLVGALNSTHYCQPTEKIVLENAPPVYREVLGYGIGVFYYCETLLGGRREITDTVLADLTGFVPLSDMGKILINTPLMIGLFIVGVVGHVISNTIAFIRQYKLAPDGVDTEIKAFGTTNIIKNPENSAVVLYPLYRWDRSKRLQEVEHAYLTKQISTQEYERKRQEIMDFFAQSPAFDDEKED